jgi:hypothetical protein
VIGFGAVHRDREAGEELLGAAIMARPGVGQRAQQGETLRNARVLGQEFGNVHAWDAGGNGPIGAAVLGRGFWFGIIGFQMARPAVQPNDKEALVFAGLVLLCLRTLSK